MMNSNKTSQYNAYKKMLVALLLTSSMGVMTGCGSEEKEPETDKTTEKEKEEKKEDVSIWTSENENIEIFAHNDLSTFDTSRMEGEELGGYSSLCVLSTFTPNPIHTVNLQTVNDQLYVIFYQHFEESASYNALPHFYGEDAFNNLSEHTVMAKIISSEKNRWKCD